MIYVLFVSVARFARMHQMNEAFKNTSLYELLNIRLLSYVIQS
jgi:hypothetical protein